MLASNRWSQYIPLTCASKVNCGNGLLELKWNSSLGMRTHTRWTQIAPSWASHLVWSRHDQPDNTSGICVVSYHVAHWTKYQILFLSSQNLLGIDETPVVCSSCMDRDPIAFLPLLLYRSLPLRRQEKRLVELTLCATMQEWVMKAAGARCWMSIWYVSGDGLIPRPSIFFFCRWHKWNSFYVYVNVLSLEWRENKLKNPIQG